MNRSPGRLRSISWFPQNWPWTLVILTSTAAWVMCGFCSLAWSVAIASGPAPLVNDVVQANNRSVREGIYSEAQATRGERLYLEECASCHGDKLAGGEFGPGLVGEAFLQQWSGETVADLFARVRSSMPQDSPGRLAGRQYADIVARMLQGNGFPAGADDLSGDEAVLKQFLIESKEPGK
jgi:mono/diheme cytochrome c family protein